MSLRFLVRGMSVCACAAIASTAFLAPAHAAPVPTLALNQLALSPLSPAIPSDEDIARAKDSAAQTVAESAKLDSILSSARERLQLSTLASLRANTTFTDALLTAAQRKEEAAAAKAKAELAANQFKAAKAKLGTLAGNLYKSGGLNLDMKSFLASSSADDAIYQATTLMVLSEDSSRTFSSASASSATSTALDGQARAAQKAADDAARAAADAKSAAQTATDAQATIVAENTSTRGILLQQLATLNNTTAELEGARVDALAVQSQEAALVAQIRASSKTSVPVVPRTQALLSSQQPVTGVPAPVAPAAPVVPLAPPAPPVVAPPVNNPPVTPAQPVTPPQQPVTPPPVVQPPVQTPAQPAGSSIQVMVNYAMSKIGGSYAWGGTGPTAFDCSGLVYKSFAAAGISVPRTGTAQFWAAPQRVPLSQMRYGDLLVFNDDGTGNFSHIAIYIGNNQVVQALNYSYPIQVIPLSWMSGMNLYPYAARY